jgi:vitamin B12 transporter
LLAAYDWRNEHVDSTQTFTANSRQHNAFIGGYQGWYGAHSLQLSVRRDDIAGFDPRTSSSAAYGYEILQGLRVRVSVGHAFHVPTFNQLYWPADPINYFQGNPHLKAERAFNREAGLAYEAGDTQAGVTYFHNQVTDLLNYVPAFSSPYLGQYENIGRATLKGVSTFVTQKVHSWTFRGSYDYLDAKNDDSGLALQRRVPHSGSISADCRQGLWNAGVQVLAYSAHYNDSANTQRLGAYSLTNIYASRTIEGAWVAFARINNLFDRKYTEVRDPFNGNDYTTPGVSLFVGIRYSPR